MAHSNSVVSPTAKTIAPPTTIPTAVPASAWTIVVPVASACERSTESVPSATQNPCCRSASWATSTAIASPTAPRRLLRIGDGCELVPAIDLARRTPQLLAHERRRLLDPPTQQHGIRPFGDVAHSLAHHRLGQHCRRGRPVTDEIRRLAGDLAHEVGPHVLEGIREMNLLGDAHAVVSDHRSPRHLLEHDVAALGAERHLDGVGELVHSSLEISTGVLLINQHFRYERSPPSAGVG